MDDQTKTTPTAEPAAPQQPASAEDASRELAELRTALARERRAAALEREARRADAVDAVTVAELAAHREGEPAEVVRTLQREKPFLFNLVHDSDAAHTPGIGAAQPEPGAPSPARVAGDRGSLLRYMRARRR